MCKDQESIQSSTTPDPGYQWESDNILVFVASASSEGSGASAHLRISADSPDTSLFAYMKYECRRRLKINFAGYVSIGVNYRRLRICNQHKNLVH